MNVVRVIRKHERFESIAVAHDVPPWIRKEFQLEAVPTLLNCWGRWALLSQKCSLPGWLDRIGERFYAALSTLLLWTATFLPNFVTRRIPGMEGVWVNAIKEAKTIWCTGGGYLTDDGKKEARAILWTSTIALTHRVRIVMTGQGLGPFRTLTTRLLIKLVIKRAMRVTCRENTTGPALLAGMRIPRERYRPGVDDACSLPSRCDSVHKGEALAIHFRRSTFHQYADRVEMAMKETIAHVLSNGQKVRLFVFHERPQAERAVYELWMQGFSDLGDIEIIEYSDPRRLRGALAQCSVAIGMAYHFYLFALLQGIPALALFHGSYYEEKFLGVARNFKRGADLLDSSAVSARGIVDWLEGSSAVCRESIAKVSEQMADAADEQLLTTLELAVERDRSAEVHARTV